VLQILNQSCNHGGTWCRLEPDRQALFKVRAAKFWRISTNGRSFRPLAGRVDRIRTNLEDCVRAATEGILL